MEKQNPESLSNPISEESSRYVAKPSEMAARGESHDIMDALRLLTEAYIDFCGISEGNRTIVYIATERWVERLAWQDLPLSDRACSDYTFEMFPLFSSNYDSDEYDEYDICGMSKEEYIKGCYEMIEDEEVDDSTSEVLAWGIIDSLKKFEPYEVKIKAVFKGDPTCVVCKVEKQGIGGTFVSVSDPMNISGGVCGLCKDVGKMVEQMLSEYQALISKEVQIRALYPEYKKMADDGGKKGFRRYRLFDDVYGDLLGDTILDCRGAIRELFGLEI